MVHSKRYRILFQKLYLLLDHHHHLSDWEFTGVLLFCLQLDLSVSKWYFGNWLLFSGNIKLLKLFRISSSFHIWRLTFSAFWHLTVNSLFILIWKLNFLGILHNTSLGFLLLFWAFWLVDWLVDLFQGGLFWIVFKETG